jgi:hypothetical protein
MSQGTIPKRKPQRKLLEIVGFCGVHVSALFVEDVEGFVRAQDFNCSMIKEMVNNGMFLAVSGHSDDWGISLAQKTFWVQCQSGGSVFSVTPTMNNIDSLKDAIKAKKPNACAHVDADQITILAPGTGQAVTKMGGEERSLAS